jgi:hypothetical protein
MAFDWGGFTPPLTNAQKTALDYFENLGEVGGGAGGQGALGGNPPAYTWSQTKAARLLAVEVMQRAEAAVRGARICLEYYRAEAARAAEEANP